MVYEQCEELHKRHTLSPRTKMSEHCMPFQCSNFGRKDSFSPFWNLICRSTSFARVDLPRSVSMFRSSEQSKSYRLLWIATRSMTTFRPSSELLGSLWSKDFVELLKWCSSCNGLPSLLQTLAVRFCGSLPSATSNTVMLLLSNNQWRQTSANRFFRLESNLFNLKNLDLFRV